MFASFCSPCNFINRLQYTKRQTLLSKNLDTSIEFCAILLHFTPCPHLTSLVSLLLCTQHPRLLLFLLSSISGSSSLACSNQYHLKGLLKAGEGGGGALGTIFTDSSRDAGWQRCRVRSKQPWTSRESLIPFIPLASSLLNFSVTQVKWEPSSLGGFLTKIRLMQVSVTNNHYNPN